MSPPSLATTPDGSIIAPSSGSGKIEIPPPKIGKNEVSDVILEIAVSPVDMTILRSADVETISQLEERLNQRLGKDSSNSGSEKEFKSWAKSLEVGHYAVAFVKQLDGWFRVRITEKKDDGKKMQVHLVDHGGDVMIKRKEFRPLTAEEGSIPAGSIRVSLKNCLQPGSEDAAKPWPDSVTEKMEAILDRVTKVHFVGRKTTQDKGVIYLVHAFLKDGSDLRKDLADRGIIQKLDSYASLPSDEANAIKPVAHIAKPSVPDVIPTQVSVKKIDPTTKPMEKIETKMRQMTIEDMWKKIPSKTPEVAKPAPVPAPRSEPIQVPVARKPEPVPVPKVEPVPVPRPKAELKPQNSSSSSGYTTPSSSGSGLTRSSSSGSGGLVPRQILHPPTPTPPKPTPRSGPILTPATPPVQNGNVTKPSPAANGMTGSGPIDPVNILPMSLKKGSSFWGLISEFKNPFDFWVQNSDDIDTVQDITERLTSAVEEAEHLKIKSSDLYQLVPGNHVAAQFTDSCFYRAVILERVPVQESVRVRFIDFGNCDTIKVTGLRRLPEEFISPRAFAVECQMTGILPIGGGNIWSQVAIDEFSKEFDSCILNVEFTAKLKDKFKYLVKLTGVKRPAPPPPKDPEEGEVVVVVGREYKEFEQGEIAVAWLIERGYGKKPGDLTTPTRQPPTVHTSPRAKIVVN